ncbi:MAG: TIGR02466 family protein [bacterium]|nr:hypothetical protein [Gammaproteobacteria bacterium]HIL96456.1 hypothetical protein [Pseudomonadales bacterium]
MNDEDWLQNSDVYSLFPTLVWKIQLPAEITTNQNPLIVDAIRKINPKIDDIEEATYWQSHQLLHKEAELEQVMSCITSAAHKVLRFLNIGANDIEVTGCWANVISVGASHRMHNHPNNYLSGVYYVRVSTGANTINFHDPRPQSGIIRPPVTQLTGQNTDQVVVEVTDGTLLLFPSYLLHSLSYDNHNLAVFNFFRSGLNKFQGQTSQPLPGRSEYRTRNSWRNGR